MATSLTWWKSCVAPGRMSVATGLVICSGASLSQIPNAKWKWPEKGCSTKDSTGIYSWPMVWDVCLCRMRRRRATRSWVSALSTSASAPSTTRPKCQGWRSWSTSSCLNVAARSIRAQATPSHSSKNTTASSSAKPCPCHLGSFFKWRTRYSSPWSSKRLLIVLHINSSSHSWAEST